MKGSKHKIVNGKILEKAANLGPNRDQSHYFSLFLLKGKESYFLWCDGNYTWQFDKSFLIFGH